MSEIVKTILKAIPFPEDGSSGLRERIFIKTIVNDFAVKNDDDKRLILLLNKLLQLFTISDRYIKLITETFPLKCQYRQKLTIAQLNKKCNECENEKSELEVKCRHQDATIINFTEKIEEQENKIANLKQENSTLQKLKNDMEHQYDDKMKQYETEYARCEELTDRLDEKDKQIKDLNDKKEKLTDLLNSNNTQIKSKNVTLENELKTCKLQLDSALEELAKSRQREEELHRGINTNLIYYKENQQKLDVCENDKSRQTMQLLECQQALQKCKEDKESDRHEYNKLILLQKHSFQECENDKQIKYDEYNTLVKNINETNKSNIEILEQLYKKPTLSNSDLIQCFSSILHLDNDEMKATGKSQIEAIINRFIHQFKTECDNYIHEERDKDSRNRISRLNRIIKDPRQDNILNIYTNEEERNLFKQILEKFKTNIIDETVYQHKYQIIPYVNENDHLKSQLDEPINVAKLLIDAFASMVVGKDMIMSQIVALERDFKGTKEEVIKVYTFVTVIYTLFQKEIGQDLKATNVQRFYNIILDVIHRSPGNNDISEILALQQQKDLDLKTLQQRNERITSELSTIQQTNTSLLHSNNELNETRMHLSMINNDDASLNPVKYNETQMNSFTSIIRAITTQLDAYLTGTCHNKYLKSAFDKLSVRKIFCRNEMAKSEMLQLFYSLSNHIIEFIFCAQFYKNLVKVINDTILRRSIQLNLHFSREMYNRQAMLSAILNIPMINEAMKITPVLPILYNINNLTLINGTYSMSKYEDQNQTVSIDNDKKNLKSIALLHEANMEAEISWFIKNLEVKYESVLGDDSVLKAISPQKFSAPETVETTRTTTILKRNKTNSGARSKYVKQMTKDKTQNQSGTSKKTDVKNLTQGLTRAERIREAETKKKETRSNIITMRRGGVNIEEEKEDSNPKMDEEEEDSNKFEEEMDEEEEDSNQFEEEMEEEEKAEEDL